MPAQAGRRDSAEAAAALVVAQLRYWTTVAPGVRRRFRRWYDHAQKIADPVLRAHAATKLQDEWGNTEVIATLCTLAPRRHRRTVIDAAVALQVMYDYLDAVTEEPASRSLEDGRQLFRTFAVALTPGEPPVDYYRYHPHHDDSGYLDALVAEARAAIEQLPALAAVLPIARAAALRFGEAQVRSHAVEREGVLQLEAWATKRAATTGLDWWEWAGGAAASVLAIHALLSAGADAATTRAQAVQIDHAYLLGSALTTMLDSLIDDDADETTGSHRYVSYYGDAETAACRIAWLARVAVVAARRLPHAAHHTMTIAGIAGFYLSHPAARQGDASFVGARIAAELEPIILPILTTFRLWRRVKSLGR
jgi:tetraprenyl-beta-curcumene synthase